MPRWPVLEIHLSTGGLKGWPAKTNHSKKCITAILRGVPGLKPPQNTKDRSIYVENKSASFSKSNEPLVTFAWQKLLLPHDKFQIKLLKNCELKCANTVQTGAAAPEKLHQGFVASKMGLETDKEIWGGTRRVTCGSNNSFSQIFLSGCWEIFVWRWRNPVKRYVCVSFGPVYKWQVDTIMVQLKLNGLTATKGLFSVHQPPNGPRPARQAKTNRISFEFSPGQLGGSDNATIIALSRSDTSPCLCIPIYTF